MSDSYRNVGCRACGACLMAADGAPVEATPLPSEYWAELSDMWVCHADQQLAPSLSASLLQAKSQTVACPPPRVVLVGIPYVECHPRHIRYGAVQVAYDASQPPPAPHTVLCATCRTPVGTVPSVVQGESGPAISPASDAAASLWPPPALGSVAIRLFKHRLARVAVATTLSPTIDRGLASWQRYTMENRLAFELLSVCQAHNRYHFVLRARPRGTAIYTHTQPVSAVGSFPEESAEVQWVPVSLSVPEAESGIAIASGTSPVCLCITVLNLDCGISSDALPALESCEQPGTRTFDNVFECQEV